MPLNHAADLIIQEAYARKDQVTSVLAIYVWVDGQQVNYNISQAGDSYALLGAAQQAQRILSDIIAKGQTTTVIPNQPAEKRN